MSNTPVTPQAPYYDDYNSDKGYVRILYRPRTPVQVRELNQMQTIFQEQIGRFADHVFENGSVVIPGEIIYDTEYSFIKLAAPPASAPETYIGKTIGRLGNTLTAKIVNYKPAEGSDPFTFYVKYSAADTVNQTQKFGSNETIFIETESVTTANSATATGYGSAAHVKRGVYYFNSVFVLVLDQTVVLDKYGNSPTAIVGLEVTQEIVTPEQDPSLLDNASGTLNYTAPGAHRLKMLADLVNKSDLTTFENFIQLLVVENGVVKEKARNVDYSVLDQTLARRTYDESGDYVVDPFIISVREHLDDGTNHGVYSLANGGNANKLALELDPGKAYVRGFEVDTISNTFLEIDKSRETANSQNATIFQPGGSYFLVDFDVSGKANINIASDYPVATLYNGSNQAVATARISYIRNDVGNVYRVYIFGYTPTGTAVFSATGNRIKISTVFDALLVSTTLQETGSKAAVFPLPYGVVSSVSGVAFQKVKQLAGTVSGSQVTMSGLGSGESFFSTDENAYGVIDANNDIYPVTSVAFPVLTVLGSPVSPARVFAPVQKVNGSLKAKTKQTASASGAYNLASISLGKADCFKITSIIGPGSEDLTEYYDLDTGQNDRYYGLGKAVKKRPLPISSGSVVVNFEYFSHGSGEFFTVNSYPGTVDYEDIPSFKGSDGKTLFLASCIDYRPRINDAGTSFTSTGSSFNESVLPNSSAFFDFDYYLGRIDKVVLSQDGKFGVVKGTSAIVPDEPKDQDNTITLYKLSLGAYTFNKDDVKVETVDHRRYTMRDIGRLSKRLSTLEYYTALSLLEKDTFNRVIADDNGDELFKSGIVVDRFSGHNVGDVENPDYSISMDLDNSEARPEASTKAVQLGINEFDSSGYQIHTDSNVITLPYSEIKAVEQPLATRVERINPFEVFSWGGSMRLVPENDFWYSDERLPDVVTNQEGIFDSIQFTPTPMTSGLGTLWNSWNFSWAGIVGRVVAGQAGRIPVQTASGLFGATSTVTQNRSSLTRVDTKLVSDKIVATSVIPFIRNRQIEFKASGLLPRARVYPFFEGVNVSAYVKPDGGGFGGALIVDAAGNISGIFSVPNTDSVRFRTGERTFKLTDSSTNNDAEATTTTSAVYKATGILNSRQANYVSVRTSIPLPAVINAATRRTSIIGWKDPLAQSFLIDEPGGSFATSIDLFFGPEVPTDNFPVTVQIRTMVNGYPGPEILPFGEVTLPASQINPYNSSAAIPVNRFVATKFRFPAPVYLQENTEYAIVVLSNSPTRTMFVAQMGQPDIATGQKVVKQPYAGVLFKSQNGSTWIADQTSDMKFKLNRASFTTGSVSELRFDNEVSFNDATTEANPFLQRLGVNPLYVTIPSPGTVEIKVVHKNHGHEEGDLVALTLPNSNPINGIPANVINGNSVAITNVTVDSYTMTFATSTGSVSEGIGGGSGIVAQQKVVYSVAQFIGQQLLQTGTHVDWSFIGVNRGGSSTDTQETPVILGENTVLPVVKKVSTADDSSVRLFARMSSERENLSPMIDLDRIALIGTANRIETISDITDEAVPSGGPAIARYITRPISLENAGNRLNVYINANRPPKTKLAVFVKFSQASDAVWTQMTAVSVPGETSDPNEFSEYQYMISTDSFAQFSVKVVLYVDPSVVDAELIQASVPRLRDFRAIALVE